MSFLDSVVNVAKNIVNTAIDVAGPAALAAFPQLAIAAAATNLITQGTGGAVNAAVDGLCRQAGLPKFLADGIKDVVNKVVQGLLKQSDPACDEAVRHHCGTSANDFFTDLTRSIIDAAKRIMEQCGPEKGKGKGGKASAGSWLEAIALAMGEAAGKKAADMVKLSNDLNNIKPKSDSQADQQAAALEANKVNAQFQAKSQEFNMLQSAFSNAIKSIGEGMSQMARKG
jgi:hypothetical protein